MTVPYMMLSPLIALAVAAVLLLTLSALAPRQRVMATALAVLGLLGATHEQLSAARRRWTRSPSPSGCSAWRQ